MTRILLPRAHVLGPSRLVSGRLAALGLLETAIDRVLEPGEGWAPAARSKYQIA